MNVNERDQGGRTPLHYAAIDPPVDLQNIAALDDPALAAENDRKSQEYRIANTRKLLDAGADVNAADLDGATPLMFAAQRDSVDVVQLLLDAGSDVNAVDAKGETALFGAVRNTTPAAAAIMRLLRDHGADPTIENTKGQTALRFVSRYGKPEEREIFADLLDT